VAKDGRQFDEQHGDDAPTSADSQVAATPEDVNDKPPVEYKTERCRNSGASGNHRMPADSDSHGPNADKAHV